MGVLSILAIELSAQNIANEKQQYQTSRSKKELMKMEVLKTQTSPKILDRTVSNDGVVSSLFLKEKMKTSVLKLQPAAQNKMNNVSASDKCVDRLKLSHLTIKEQMKTAVIGVDKYNPEAGNSLLEHSCLICYRNVKTDN